MSARKDQATSSFHEVTVEARQTRLSLSPESVIIHKNGIDFPQRRTLLRVGRDDADPAVSRGTAAGCTARESSSACTGSLDTGYHVSMVFTGLSKQAQARLDTLAHAPLA